MSQLPPAIFLMGPTAAGKTDLAIELTKVLPCELISVDSALVYRGMDIGTAKPTRAERAAVPHHLIDVAERHDQRGVGAEVEDRRHRAADLDVA